MAPKPPLTPNDVYHVAINQRRLLRIILLALVGYAALFVIEATSPKAESVVPITQGPPAQSRGNVVVSTELTLVNSTLILSIALGLVFLAVAWLVVVLKLLSALRVNWFARVLAILGSFVPFVSLVILLFIISRATGVLGRSGHKVGLLGVNSKTLARLKADAALA